MSSLRSSAYQDYYTRRQALERVEMTREMIVDRGDRDVSIEASFTVERICEHMNFYNIYVPPIFGRKVALDKSMPSWISNLKYVALNTSFFLDLNLASGSSF